jgi:hypothetical protein
VLKAVLDTQVILRGASSPSPSGYAELLQVTPEDGFLE